MAAQRCHFSFWQVERDRLLAIDSTQRQTGPRKLFTGAGRMSDFFKLREHGTTVGREIMAGATTFAAMAYILSRKSSDHGNRRD